MIIEAPKVLPLSTCFIVYLIAVIMYRLILCHYSLLVDEKNELYHSLLLKVIMLYKYRDGRAEHI